MASPSNQKNAEILRNPIENTVVDDSESSEDDSPPVRSTQRIIYATNATSATKKAEVVASSSSEEDDDESEDSSESDATNATTATKKAELVASEEEDEDSSESDDSESQNEDEKEKASANSVKPDPISESKAESDSRMGVKKGAEAATPTLKEPTTPLARPNNFAVCDKRVGETNGVVAVPQIAVKKGQSPLAEANNKRKAENQNNAVNVVAKRPMQNLSMDNNNDAGNQKRDTGARNTWVDSTTSPLVNPFLSPNQVDEDGSDNRLSQTVTKISFPDETIKYIFAEGVRLLDSETFADLERKRKDHQIKQLQNYLQSSADQHNLLCLHVHRIIDFLKED